MTLKGGMRGGFATFLVSLVGVLSGCALLELSLRADRQPASALKRNPETSRLVFVSYNIKALPMSSGVGERMEQMGRAFPELGADVVVLQEVWHPGVERFLGLNPYPWKAQGPTAKGFRMGAGLLTLSKFPIVDEKQAVLKGCSSWDCMARKGYLATRVDLGSARGPLWVVNVHLNSGWKEKDRNAKAAHSSQVRTRVRQIEELANEVKNLARETGEPVWIAGDFNVRGFLADHNALTGALSDWEEAGVVCRSDRKCVFKLPGEGERNILENRVDRLYIPKQRNFKVLQYSRDFDRARWDRFSDHVPLRVEIEFLSPSR